jgi:acetyl esterase/lipase
MRVRLHLMLLAAAATLLVVASANANLLPTAKVSLPVAIDPSLGGPYSPGVATLTAQYADTTANITAAGTGITLAVGQQFKVTTCVKLFAVNKTYSNQCADKAIDTRSLVNGVVTTAPTVTASLARPSGTNRASASYIVSVAQRLSNGNYSVVGSSWPSAGLTSASIAIPAQNATGAPAPDSLGAPMSTGASGGINSGLPDSFCMANSYAAGTGPGSGVSTSGLGAGAPAYYEVGQPSGAYLGKPPKGVMLLIHGGGWYQTGSGPVSYQRAEADRWRARGWRTLNIDYRACGQGLTDVLWFYDRARGTWGTAMPYCAYGVSAGGNLALLLGVARASLDCAISAAGPTDGLTLKDQLSGVDDPVLASDGPKWVHNLLTAAVGGAVYWWSPALFPINARVLWATGATDPFVPPAQGDELRDKMLARDPAAYVRSMRLDAGSAWFVHSGVSEVSLGEFYAAEDGLVAPLTA